LRGAIIIILSFENIQMTLFNSRFHCRADMITNKVTFAALAAMTVAVGLAAVPALTNQVFAAKPECPGCDGGGHEEVETEQCILPNGNVKSADEGCPGKSEQAEPQQQIECETVFAGQSDNPKGTTCDPPV
jgi:hypothetical protein